MIYSSGDLISQALELRNPSRQLGNLAIAIRYLPAQVLGSGKRLPMSLRQRFDPSLEKGEKVLTGIRRT